MINFTYPLGSKIKTWPKSVWHFLFDNVATVESGQKHGNWIEEILWKKFAILYSMACLSVALGDLIKAIYYSRTSCRSSQANIQVAEWKIIKWGATSCHQDRWYRTHHCSPPIQPTLIWSQEQCQPMHL